MEISHQLTRDDLREASRPFVRAFVWRFWLVVVVLVIVSEALLWYLRAVSGESNYALSWFLLALGLLWLPVGRWLGLEVAVRSVDPYVYEKMTVRADDAGIQVRRESGEAAFPWHFFGSWRETKNLFVLTHGKGTNVVVPKRAFEDEARAREFRALVESRLGPVTA